MVRLHLMPSPITLPPLTYISRQINKTLLRQQSRTPKLFQLRSACLRTLGTTVLVRGSRVLGVTLFQRVIRLMQVLLLLLIHSC